MLEAIAILGQRKVDAVITDVDLTGGLSGYDLARMISDTDDVAKRIKDMRGQGVLIRDIMAQTELNKASVYRPLEE